MSSSQLLAILHHSCKHAADSTVICHMPFSYGSINTYHSTWAESAKAHSWGRSIESSYNKRGRNRQPFISQMEARPQYTRNSTCKQCLLGKHLSRAKKRVTCIPFSLGALPPHSALLSSSWCLTIAANFTCKCALNQ